MGKKKSPNEQDSSRVQDYLTTVTILESLSDLIFILNVKGEIEYVNQSALETIGEPLNKVLGKYIDEFLVDSSEELSIDAKLEDYEPPVNLIQKISTGIFHEIEAAVISKGRLVPVLVNFSVIHEQEKPAYIVVSAKDISQKKRIEYEEKEQQIESISRDRIRAVGELSVGLVHEITQPLSTLMLKLELTKKKLNDPGVEVKDVDHSLGEMVGLVQKMSNIIQNIRRFAQQTEEDMLGIVNIREMVDSAISLVNHEFQRRLIEIKIQAPKHLSYVVANPLSIEQVFVNILSNAKDAFESLDAKADAQKPEKKKVLIRLKEKKDKWVEIQFIDNAGGINKKILDRIFDPFFTTHPFQSNTGMGLSIAKKIIQALGGDIHVQVTEKKGTQFIVRIPLTKSDEKTFLKNLIEIHHQKS
ncbi:MAG: PAS domain-containing protein [FCB group bacterium]|nr:PAS domain-containing protein [FCB group bacterium]